ncbi:amidohydrolase family protein [Mycobacterium botniense]|uniref:Amidohydrolase n=1 Tax=Mycobacterium botniense TaxID=84962 RepID=A0A7I9XSR4_9MYCO|nr:amidohydrolase family protein [Mycobacterium botniense]GFG72808.1 amidohydrolase [Mycobacterium botniense]
MTRTIALEEHFWTPELAAPAGTGVLNIPGWGRRLGDRLADLGQLRLADMNSAGIDMQVISHTTPAAQGLPPAESVIRAREANDRLAAAVRAHPDRFAGFATLPTADPAAAADELERAITELGFVGAMINSTLGSNGVFLDDARFEPLLERAEHLDVPIYLHPSFPPASVADVFYQGLPQLTAMAIATGAWGWHAEAGLHALRLAVTGVFERHPRLRLILGHCGEMIPFMLGRIDTLLRPELTGLKPPSEYLLRHVWITTSGMFSLAPLRCALEVFGVDRVLFSVDYPYSDNTSGRALLDQLDKLPLSAEERGKIAGGNAGRLLNL